MEIESVNPYRQALMGPSASDIVEQEPLAKRDAFLGHNSQNLASSDSAIHFRGVNLAFIHLLLTTPERELGQALSDMIYNDPNADAEGSTNPAARPQIEDPFNISYGQQSPLSQGCTNSANPHMLPVSANSTFHPAFSSQTLQQAPWMAPTASQRLTSYVKMAEASVRDVIAAWRSAKAAEQMQNEPSAREAARTARAE